MNTRGGVKCSSTSMTHQAVEAGGSNAGEIQSVSEGKAPTDAKAFLTQVAAIEAIEEQLKQLQK